MGVEVMPFGIKCNIQCQYCYQNPMRDAETPPMSYDLQKLKDSIEAEGRPFGLFGGEPLLMPVSDLDELWAWGFRRFGRNNIQTNGTLIDADHIGLFKKYRVNVGISLDGPGELNDARWAGSLNSTRRATAKVEAVIERLRAEGVAVSLIVTLTRANAAPDKVAGLYAWIRRMDSIGVHRVRLHVLESENALIRSRYGLTAAENIAALMGFLGLEPQLKQLTFDLFDDMRNMLLGRDERASCTWRACDPYTTAAVTAVGGTGERTNCGRTNKDGVDYVKADIAGFERYLALYLTPQTAGGCQDCRFFLFCKGQCPGTALAGDWRNRSEHCEVWKTLYGALEAQLQEAGEEPLSKSPRRSDIEQAFLSTWCRGRTPSLAAVLKSGDAPPTMPVDAGPPPPAHSR
jgi:uncharacterized protein